MKESLRCLAVAAGVGSILVLAGCHHHQDAVTALPPAPPNPKADAVVQQGIAAVNATPGLSDAERARRIAIIRGQFGGGHP